MTPTSPARAPVPDKLFCFGFGYCAMALAGLVPPNGVRVAGTRRSAEDRSIAGLAAFDGSAPGPNVAALLAGTTHLLVSIPPDVAGDPSLRWHGADIARLPDLRWIGLLSTVGVYGDAGGAWIDEQAPLRPQSARAQNRVTAEQQWRAFGATHGLHVDIFRLPGIYGPGRSALEALRAGTARRVVKPGQVFNRVHVHDIARALAAAMSRVAPAESRVAPRLPAGDAYNLADDEPAPPQDVIAYAAALIGVPPPPEVAFDLAPLSPMAASFYAENKRIDNRHLKTVFGFSFMYPSYREGLRAIALGSASHRST